MDADYPSQIIAAVDAILAHLASYKWYAKGFNTRLMAGKDPDYSLDHVVYIAIIHELRNTLENLLMLRPARVSARECDRGAGCVRLRVSEHFETIGPVSAPGVAYQNGDVLQHFAEGGAPRGALHALKDLCGSGCPGCG